MKYKDLINIIGSSIDNNSTSKILKNYNLFNLESKKSFNRNPLAKTCFSNNSKLGIFAEFLNPIQIKSHNLSLLQFENIQESDLVLASLKFLAVENTDQLVFGIKKNWSLDELSKTLGSPIRELFDFLYFEFHKNNLQFDVKFEDHKEIRSICISIPSYQFSLAVKRSKGFQLIKSYKFESTSIKKELTVKKDIILKRWEEGLLDFIEAFEEEINDDSLNDQEKKFVQIQIKKRKVLNESFNAIISDYINRISLFTEMEIKHQSLLLAKEIILKFNKINIKYNSIQTGEREDICSFINTSIKLLGVKLHQNEDITYQWRRW